MTDTDTDTNPKPTILLVHGAWADGSSWLPIIRLLLKAGYAVRSIQIPLTGLADDVAAVQRTIADVDGPIVLVGHSWGGTVVTEAGTDPRIKALVYVAAFGNEAGQSGGELLEPYPPLGVMGAIRPDNQGFLLVTDDGMANIIAHDMPIEEARALVAVQRPLAQSVFGDKVTTPAWQSRPSWYLVASDDRAFSPEIQRDIARKVGATTSEVAASHMLILSHADEVAAVIERAAEGVRSA